jgi:hypothetical protein
MSSRLDTALLTPVQALVKWCPEVRVANCEKNSNGDSVNSNSAGIAIVGTQCVSYRCMFWRWHDDGERHQSPTVIDKRNLFDDAPKSRTDGTWYVYLPQFEDQFNSWKDAVEYVLGGNDVGPQDVVAFTRDGDKDEVKATSEIIGILSKTQVIYRLIPPPLPPRGYCGKAGHPHAASLIEGQLELLRHQLWEHQHAA